MSEPVEDYIAVWHTGHAAPLHPNDIEAMKALGRAGWTLHTHLPTHTLFVKLIEPVAVPAQPSPAQPAPTSVNGYQEWRCGCGHCDTRFSLDKGAAKAMRIKYPGWVPFAKGHGGFEHMCWSPPVGFPGHADKCFVPTNGALADA